MKPYSKPILTSIFYLLGVVSLLIGAWLLILGLSNRNGTDLIAGASSIMGGLLQLGFGQAVDFLGRTAYFAERTYRATVSPERHAELEETPRQEPVVMEQPNYRAMLP
jgi:hypothetical protein